MRRKRSTEKRIAKVCTYSLIQAITKAGFSILNENLLGGIVVPAGSSCSLPIQWTPSQAGASRQLLRIYVDKSYRLSAKLIGISYSFEAIFLFSTTFCVNFSVSVQIFVVFFLLS
jgi:hypothetical protein